LILKFEESEIKNQMKFPNKSTKFIRIISKFAINFNYEETALLFFIVSIINSNIFKFINFQYILTNAKNYLL
jgi:uncharacterized membrane protein YdbT with pleckstrin-like domain